MIYDRRTAARGKEMVYKMVVRRAVMYNLETVALTRRQEAEEVAKFKMLRS